MEEKKDIRKLDLEELQALVVNVGQPKFRGKQIYEWIWKKNAHSFQEMSNVPKALREELEIKYCFRSIKEDQVQISKDGTIKTRYTLFDGHKIESVLIPVPKDRRFTVCVSSQVGCSLTCSFCATGKMKRVRNLDAAEIYDQVAKVNVQSLAHYDHPLTNIVFMGMGEPLLTYKNVLQSIEMISSPEGMGMSPRRITVSTAGIAKMIRKLADDKVRFNLALSLHAADDEKRDKIMPINEQNNLETLMDALEYFYLNTKNKISYEYIIFKDFNDSLEDARKLARLCKRFPVRINIIEYNQVEGVSFTKSEMQKVDAFASFLSKKGITVTVRRSRGEDIDAACGQLANKG